MDAATLRRAMQPTQVSDATLADYLPHYIEAMRAAQINTVRRAAAWHSQIGHESAGLRYMAEIQTNGPGWSDDRRIYRGRGPIQLTWSGNYRKFGQWCQAQGYIDNAELFVQQPELVEQPRWGFLAASWYWLFGGPRAGQINGFADAGDILAVSYCVNGWRAPAMPNGWPDRQARWNNCLAMGDDALPPSPSGEQPVPAAPQPPLKELDFMTGGGRSNRSRPPINWLIHTEEGSSSAENLARYCNGSHDVSYHYTLRDGILCDVVDTDYASWSVLDANAYTINLCFAGSRAAMTRDEWLARDADMRIAAFIAVADCRKYKIPLDIIAPPYGAPRPGISDHKYVTQALHIGTHTDVGNNFPWDVFGRYVSESAGTAPPPVSPPPFVPDVLDRAGGTIDDQLLYRWNCLGGQTQIEALAEIRDKVCGTNDRGKTGVKTL